MKTLTQLKTFYIFFIGLMLIANICYSQLDTTKIDTNQIFKINPLWKIQFPNYDLLERDLMHDSIHVVGYISQKIIITLSWDLSKGCCNIDDANLLIIGDTVQAIKKLFECLHQKDNEIKTLNNFIHKKDE